MLLRFVVSNFLSISDEVEFNMFPGDYRRHKDHIYCTEQIDLLKSTAIYGANGAGKSNLVKAMNYLHDLVLQGEVQNTNNYCFKLKDECKSLPTKFEIEFKYGNRYYSYGISILGSVIQEEWLFEEFPRDGSSEMIFERKAINKGKVSLNLHDKYTENDKDKLLVEVYEEEILEPNKPFIHLVHEKEKYKEITEAYQWFHHYFYIIHPKSIYQGLVARMIEDKNFKNFANSLLPTLDTGLFELDVEEVPFEVYFGEKEQRRAKELLSDLFDEDSRLIVRYDYDNENQIAITKEDDSYLVYKLISRHKATDGKLKKFEIFNESDGTKRLLDFIPALEMLIDDPVTFVIDEIDRSIHPALLKKLIEQFLKTNTKGQLIFTTHESNLLDLNLFRQDEIWFAEKDKTGSTRLYSLSEFKPRYDLDIQKGYLNGRFGAIPFLGNLEDLNWEHAEEEQTV
jgi:hypothetical protein